MKWVLLLLLLTSAAERCCCYLTHTHTHSYSYSLILTSLILTHTHLTHTHSYSTHSYLPLLVVLVLSCNLQCHRKSHLVFLQPNFPVYGRKLFQKCIKTSFRVWISSEYTLKNEFSTSSFIVAKCTSMSATVGSIFGGSGI